MNNKFKSALCLSATLITLTTVFSTVNTRAAKMPGTEGHDKYVDGKVFDVISSDTFGTKDLDSPLFDKTRGSNDISDLLVPTLAYDDTSIGLVWKKPEKYDNIADYHVYINGKLQETARENFKVNAEWTAKYMDAFYDYYQDKGNSDIDTVNVDIHSFLATGLKPDTNYSFSVVAIDEAGNELGTPKSIDQKTTPSPEVFDITEYGAKTSEGYTTYDDETNTFIEANTKAIQDAIDACTPGGKVVIPEGTFVSGAIWLKSDMTLEVNGTLWASPNSDHFEIGFHMYPFYTDTRGWGLINAVSSDESQPLENIRVTGNGTVYGNGWKYGAKDAIYKDGYIPNAGDPSTQQAGDVDLTVEGNEKYALPRWVAGNNKKVYHYGVQAADSARKYLSNVTDANGSKKYSDDVVNALAGKIATNKDDKLSEIDAADLTNAYATRSSLIIMRNVTNVYLGDVTVMNPANHSVNILDSRNVSATNVKVLSYDGNNGDGLGFGCSQNVICWNNCNDTGDDNLGFGASVGEGARDCDIQTNSEVWMFNNFLREGHGGLAAGSHTGNGIQDVLFEDTVMNHIDAAFRFKSAPTNGGFGANITMRDCAAADPTQGWVLTTSYSDPNSASSTEAAEIGRFYNFASYNISVYGPTQNTICVYADVDPVNHPDKPWHVHSNLYFQDITFGDVGGNGSFKNYNGWDTLTGCENSVFYNVKTNSYNGKAIDKKNDRAWTNIKYSKNIRFQGSTLETLNADTAVMDNISSAPAIDPASEINAVSAQDGRSADLSWSAADDNSGNVLYGVDTFLDDEKVDAVDGIEETSATLPGLSSGVTYTFKIYASDETGNKTELGETTLTTSGDLDTADITAPASIDVALSNGIYTCAQAEWPSAYQSDARVRGYQLYANGDLKKTVYNYQIPDYKNSETVSKQIGRLTPGTDNNVEIKAFTDAGTEFSYNQASIRTLDNYDYKAPVFPENVKVTATVSDNGDVVLTWDAASDDTKVNGYRVYVDQIPVFGKDGKAFNPVNGAITTSDTTWTISGLDLTKEHTFTIQAGDSWWKAEQTMGNFDKMADFNWTVKGISTSRIDNIPAGPTEPSKPDETTRYALEKLLEMVDGLDEQDFTKDSWAALIEKYNNAKSLLQSDETTQEQYDAAYADLAKAFNDLNEGPNTTAAEVLVREAQKILQESHKYRPDAIQKLQHALDLVNKDLKNPSISQSELDEHSNELLDAMIHLLDIADASNLQKLVDIANEFLSEKEKFTSTSISDLENALKNAEVILADDNRTSSQISDISNQISDAIGGLVLRGNRDNLKPWIEKAESILAEEIKYTPTSIQGLRETLDQANIVYQNIDATIADVKNSISALTEELSQVRILGDLDGDGEVTTKDAVSLLRSAAELDDLTWDAKDAADVNLDGVIDTRDASMILQYSSELISSFR